MFGYIFRRLGAALVLLLLVLSFTFLLLQLAPGDPTLMVDDPRLGPEDRAALRHVYGLDRPLPLQYLTWMRSILVDGDWGTSFVHRRPVAQVIAERLPATLLLCGCALALQFAVGIAIGGVAARHRARALDHGIRLGSLLLYSMPIFWIGLMCLLLLSYTWPLFPPGHVSSIDAVTFSPLARFVDLLHHLALPVLVLVLGGAGVVSRFTRNSLLEVLEQDYIRTARAKGLSQRRVLWVHALRNAAPPLIQLLGLSLPFLLSGSLVVEVVFSWPGLGRLTFDAIDARDYPVVLATTALTGSMVVAGNLLADLLHAAVDPRVRQ